MQNELHMVYTVKKLSQIAKISVRTLHFYDEIGLLKPAYYGKNNYRYYGEEQLLMLQQILFFRELDFSLHNISTILTSKDFDKIIILNTHKKVLESSIDKKNKLLETIEKTIAYLEGTSSMKHEELYYGFDSEKQKNYEFELVSTRICNQELINQSREQAKNKTQEEWAVFKTSLEILHKNLVEALHKKLDPSSCEVQKLIQQHYQAITFFYTPTKEIYKGLSLMYQTHPDFRKFYDTIDPELVDFLASGMNFFADQELK
jgi:DNA-binding transcriptional MerR regulator